MANESRESANQALRGLLDRVQNTLFDVPQKEYKGHIFQEFESESGLNIHRFDGRLWLTGEFVKPDGTEETVEIHFPTDTRDLSLTEVSIEWVHEGRDGTNTPPLRDYPKLAGELLALL